MLLIHIGHVGDQITVPVKCCHANRPSYASAKQQHCPDSDMRLNPDILVAAYDADIARHGCDLLAVAALGSGQNFQIKRAQLLSFSRINAFTEVTDMNHLRLVSRGAEFAVKRPVIATLGQLPAALPLQIFFDIAPY